MDIGPSKLKRQCNCSTIKRVNPARPFFCNTYCQMINVQVYIDTSDKLTPKAKLSAAERILSVPRRPAWTGLTPQQLSDKENDAFLDWRR